MTVLSRPQIIDSPLTLILRMGRLPCCCLVCLHKLPIRCLCITATRSPFNYHIYMTTNRLHSVDAPFDPLSIQNLLPYIIVFIMIWAYWLSFWQIETLPFGKAERSNILALFALPWLKFIYLAKTFIAPAIHLLIYRYSQTTAHHSAIIYLQPTVSVKLHKEAGETLTHSVLHFLHSLIPPCFYCINHHQDLFGLSIWLSCWPNHSGHIWGGSHIPLLWAIQILDAIALLNIRFNICHAIVFAVNSIIQVAIVV